MVKCLSSAAAVVVCLVTSAAAASTYVCKIATSGKAQGWIALQEEDGAAQIFAAPLGYANSFMAQGACATG